MLLVVLKTVPLTLSTPHHPARKGAAYKKERQLLYILATQGVEKVDIRHFIAAYFEDSPDDASAEHPSAMTDLARQLQRAFPFADVINEIKGFSEAQDIEAYAKSLKQRVNKYKIRHPVRHFRMRHQAAA